MSCAIEIKLGRPKQGGKYKEFSDVMLLFIIHVEPNTRSAWKSVCNAPGSSFPKGHSS